MIARIIPLRRLPRGKDYFDYAISPELQHKLRLGQRVSIPFMRQMITGIVADVQKDEATRKLKSIGALLESEPVMPAWQLELLRVVALETGVSMGTATKLFFLHFTKKRSIDPSPPPQPTAQVEGSTADAVVERILSAAYPTLLTHEKSINRLVARLCARATENKGQVLVLTPSTNEAQVIEKTLNKQSGITTMRFDPALPASQKTTIATAASGGNAPIVVGTRSALFLPFTNLKAIVLLRSENGEYKQYDQNPRYDGRSIALRLAAITKARCVFVATTPRVEDVFATRGGNMQHIHVAPSTPLPMPLIINLKDEKMSGRNKLISYVAEEAIAETLAQKKRVLLFVGKKGSTGAVVCKDCGWLAKFVPHPPGRKLQVESLQDNFTNNQLPATDSLIREIPALCPICHGAHIKKLRAGTSAVMQDALDLFPEATAMLVEKEKDAGAAECANITVGTHALFEKAPPKNLGLAVLIDADQPLFTQGFRSSEKAYQLLTRLRAWVSMVDAPKFFLQTRFPELTLFTAFQKNEPALFYSEELGMREQFQLPPYRKQVRIFVKGKVGTTAQKGKALMARLGKYTTDLLTNNGPTTKATTREQEETSILITYKPPYDIFALFHELPDEWIIDHEPVT